MKKKIAVYPISGCPPTWGHADIMFRAAKKFDFVYWVAATNIHKELIFSKDFIAEMMKMYVDYYKLKNVKVEVWEGATIRYAMEREADFIIRGLRNDRDFLHEYELSIGNRGIHKEIETICMFTKPHYACISSGLVRELALLGEKTDQYCLPEISRMVSEKIGKSSS